MKMDSTRTESPQAAAPHAALSTPRMEEDVHMLVLLPFQEVVEKGRLAIKNARTVEPPLSEEMAKAAQSLVKAGERALNVIEPLCRKRLDEYGSNFVDALKENDGISKFRTKLDGLLFDFDTYTEVDEFDPDEFTNLQLTSRDSVLQMRDIVLRMKLEPPETPIQEPVRTPELRLSLPVDPSSPHAALEPRSPVFDPVDISRPLSSLSNEGQLRNGFDSRGLDSTMAEQMLAGGSPRSSRQSSNPGPVRPPKEIPSEPLHNPWRLDRLPPYPADFGTVETSNGSDRRPPAVPGEESTEDYSTSLHASAGVLDGSQASRVDGHRGESSHVPHPSSGGWSQGSAYSPTESRHSGPLEFAVSPTADDQPAPPSTAPPNAYPSSPERSSTGSTYQLGADSLPPRGNLNNAAGDPGFGGSAAVNGDLEPGSSITAHPASVPWDDLTSDQPGLEPVHPAMIPGVSPDDPHSPYPSLGPNPRDDCAIGPDSSYSLHKGLCPGAREALLGGPGVIKTKKPGTWSGTVSVARCKSCLFDMDWKLFESDLRADGSPCYTSCGLNFRVRLVFKSHLPAKTVDDQLYACLFCLEEGRTVEDSDATVFFTQKQLFAHLARHPRPFPQVRGLVVVQQRDSAEARAAKDDDYDLCVLNPPVRSIMAGLERPLAAMPAAVTTETVRRRGNNSIRSPPDRPQVLEFAAGARIVGVEFPPRYKGEWAMGWADGVRGAFPADSVRLVPPIQDQLRVSTEQGLRAVARWKHSPKHPSKQKSLANWLKFEKGEVITGIAFMYVEHWCWSGYNSKKKWGIFPQAYIEPNTLSGTPTPGRDSGSNSTGDRNSVHSQEGRGNILTRISSSLRHRDTGTTSSGESHTSGGEMAPTPARDLRLNIH